MTVNVDDLLLKIKNNDFYPRALIATSSCIGAGLDCSDFCVVARDGFPTSLLDFAQEIGRCGRSEDSTTNEKAHRCFQLMLSMNSFLCLVERMRSVEDVDSSLVTEE